MSFSVIFSSLRIFLPDLGSLDLHNSDFVKSRASSKCLHVIAKVALSIFVGIGVGAAIVFFAFPIAATAISLSLALAAAAMIAGGVALVIILGTAGYKCYKQHKERVLQQQEQQDIELIKAALGIKCINDIEQPSLDRFEKQYQITLQLIMNDISQEMKKIRQSKVTAAEGNISPKLKYVVTFKNKKIIDLCIHEVDVFTQGSFTNVHLTPNEYVTLSPKNRDGAEQQLLNAAKNIDYLWECAKTHPGEIDVSLLPPKPRKITTSQGSFVMVVPKATPVDAIFKTVPANLKETIYRLEILRDVSLVSAFGHKFGFMHADLKLDNMLINSAKKGQLHDLGGSYIIANSDDFDTAREKYITRLFTPDYTHASDLDARKNLQSRDDVVHLGRAQDIFALGLSTIEILRGRYNQSDELQLPLLPQSYINIGNVYPNKSGAREDRQDINCIQEISKDIYETLQKLLDSALDMNYKKRLSAQEYAQGLNKIIIALKALEPP